MRLLNLLWLMFSCTAAGWECTGVVLTDMMRYSLENYAELDANESHDINLHSLVANKLRTILSLIGITIGIFTIVAVRAAVDSLERNIMSGNVLTNEEIIESLKNIMSS